MSSLDLQLNDVERVFLDLDGTLYLGETVLPGALEFVQALRMKSIPLHFISNNTSNSRSMGMAKLQRLGFEPQDQEMYSALDSTFDYLQSQGIQFINLMAKPELEEEARERGFELWSDQVEWTAQDSDLQPQAVVLAFDQTFTWYKLRWGMRHMKRGARFIATHPDTYCPAPDMYDPDIACMIAAFETAGCPSPTIVGKPSPLFLSTLMNNYQQDPSKCLLIGDRIYTDMVLANSLGMKSVLTLGGEATLDDLEDLSPEQGKPDYVIEDLSEFTKFTP